MNIQIQNTTNYNKFKSFINRDVSDKHSDLIASSNTFAESFPYHPIVVNEKFEIIDGQHRFEAAKKLNIPIWYVIHYGASFEQLKECNIRQKPWSHTDYIKVYAKKNMPAYVTIQTLIDEYKIHPSLSTMIVQYIGATCKRLEFSKKLKHGQLELKNVEKIYEFAEIYKKLIDNMVTLKGRESIRFLSTRPYCAALIHLYKHNTQKLKIITKKLPDYWKKLSIADTQEDALEILEKIRSSRTNLCDSSSDPQ